MNPALSVILPTYNGARHLTAQLSALSTQKAEYPWELIVVDNGSTDSTGKIVGRFAADHPWIRLVDAPDRHNLSYVRNVGVAASTAPALAFVDDDDIVDVGWVDAMCRALEHHELVGSRLEYTRLNSEDDLVGRERFQSERIHEMFGLPILSGAGFGCHRSVWDRAGGNDEEFSDSGEDFDFSMRVARTTGTTPFLARDAIYHYQLREDPRSTFKQARRYGRSHVQLYARHGRGEVSRRDIAMQAAKDWYWIASRLPLALIGVRRSNWARITGRRVGRLIGSIQHRCFLP